MAASQSGDPTMLDYIGEVDAEGSVDECMSRSVVGLSACCICIQSFVSNECLRLHMYGLELIIAQLSFNVTIQELVWLSRRCDIETPKARVCDSWHPP